MASLNQVNLIGNLTRNPEVRHTPKGSAVCEFGLAINRPYTNNGERKEETTFVDVTAWAQLAELIGKHITKGSTVFISGRLQTEQWEDKQTGQKRSKLTVVADNVQFLDKKEAGSKQVSPKHAPHNAQVKESNWDDDSEIPF